MAYEGWFRFGGNEVVNNERARGIAQTVACPMFWLKGPRCDSLQDALGDVEYNASNLPSAPWYDLSLPDVSGRFYGVFALSATGLNSSTRSASVVEGIDDGASIGRTRKGARSVRVRAMLLARGRDALDYGVSWLNSALDPDACGQHGTGCGTTDLEFLTDCPPERIEVEDFTEWVPAGENLFTNPSFETGAGTVEVRRNLALNPNANPSGPGFSSNNNAVWTVTKEGVTASSNPQGITTRARGQLAAGAVSATILSTFNIDALGGAGTPARTIGAWFYTTASGCQVTLTGTPPVPLPPYTWVWATGTVAAGDFSGVNVSKITGNASESEIAYITGVTALEGEADVPTATIAPGAAYPSTADPDPDLTPSWTGTANASEPILTGVRVAGMNTSAVQTADYQHTEGGDVMLRSVALSDTAKGINFVVPAADGVRYTLLMRVRSSVPMSGSVRITSVTANIDLTGEWQEIRVSQIANAAGSTGLVFVPGGQWPQGEYVDFEYVAFIEGDYTGPYFDGNTPATEITRYSWSGAENDSTSLRETREAFMRPQTDEEYAAVVDPYRRFLHNVSVTSGPIERELMNKGEFWGQIFEWTYTAGRPWVYSATRAVVLPITPTIVIQDTPFNLVPYPSAELAGAEVDAAYNFSTNPSVETNDTGWSFNGAGGITAGMLTGGRVTGELAAAGTSSYRVVFTATGAGAGGTFYAQQGWVDLGSRPSDSRVSINFWAAELLMSGAPVRADIEMSVYWSATEGGSILRVDALGTVDVDGGALSVKSLVPPAGANFALVRASASLTSWPAGTVVRLYADALAVTVP